MNVVNSLLNVHCKFEMRMASTPIMALLLRNTLLILLFLSVYATCFTKEQEILTVDRNTQKNFDIWLSNYLKSGIISPKLMNFFEKYSFKHPLHTYEDIRDIKRIERLDICSLCKTVTTTLLKNYREGQTVEELKTIVLNLCVNLKIQSEAVCNGLIELNADLIVYIIDERPNLKGEDICNTVFQSDCATANKEWSVKPTIEQQTKTKPKEWKIQSAAEDALVIIQLSDFHTDLTYSEGSLSACQEPMCCQASDGPGENSEDTAGKWGSYHSCDVPFIVSENAVLEAKNRYPKVDAVYVTGDYVNHLVWQTTRESNAESITKTFDMIKKHFGDIPIFPILGNHESNPLNQYAPTSVEEERFSTKWLYELISEHWAALIGEDAVSTIPKGGYYTALLRPGLRVVALNNNVCYTYNWWLLYEQEDLNGHLKWLLEVLIEAENNQEKVHLITHIPPGHGDCLNVWTREFHAIIERFQNTVVAQFNGHTHHDQFNLFYSSSNTSHVFNVAFNGGSVTTYTNLNPNFKVYFIDPVQGNVLNQESWTYNITQANLTPNSNPVWYKLYSFKETFGLEDMAPSTLGNLVSRYTENNDYLQQYYRFYNKNSDVYLGQSCDTSCAENLLCSIVRSNNLDNTQCDRIRNELNSKKRI